MGNVLLIGERVLNEQEDRWQAFARFRLERRRLRDRSDPFLMEAEQFRKHYRLTPPVALRFVDILEHRLVGQRSTCIPPYLQVLMALRFYAEGGLQKGVGTDFNHPMCASSICKILDRVTDAIISVSRQFVKFPATREERQTVSNSFREYNRINHIIGLIDCFKIIMWRPSVNEEAFYSHMVACSAVNVQVISNADYLILNVRVCPGSCHDQFIWNNSEIKHHLVSLRLNNPQEGPYYLLGDSGYTLSPIILTPIIGAREGSPAARYTSQHTRTRCKIEQLFGILTNVWRCISRSRKLCYKPEKVAKFVIAAAVLHNFRLLNGDIFEDDLPPDYALDQHDAAIAENNLDYQNGLAEVQNILHNFYT